MQSKKVTRRPLRRTRLLALEPRLLFDGVAVTDIPDSAKAPVEHAAVDTTPTSDVLAVIFGDATREHRETAEVADALPATSREADQRPGPHNLVVSARDGDDATTRAMLNESVQLAEQHVADLVNSTTYREVMMEVFGRDASDTAFDQALDQVHAQLAAGALGIQVELVKGHLLYGNAACYAALDAEGDERIYVNADWLAQCTSIETAALVLLEETGHAIDHRINAGVDTAGDEGELFSYRVVGQQLSEAECQRIRSEDDSGVVQIDGRSVAVEFSVSTTNPGPFDYVDTSGDDGTYASQTGTLKTGGNSDKIQGIWNGSAYVSSIAVTDSTGNVILGTVSLSAGTIGKGSTTNAGSWTFTPDSTAIQGLVSNELNRTVRIDAKSGQTITSTTLTFNFYGADDVPAGTSETVTTLEDISYAFAVADFGYTDRDTTDALSAVRIDTLPSPSAGTLMLSGVAVSAGQVIAAEDLGTLAFVPAENANGTAFGSFRYTVKDTLGGTFAPTSSVMTLNVSSVNDAPTVSAPSSFSITEDVTTQLVYTGAPFADVDSGTLTVTLSVADGAITGTGSVGITLGGTATARAFTGAVGDLNVYFTTPGNITYTPAHDNTASRALATTVSDGSAASTAVSVIDIAPVNDAPVLTAPSSAISYAAGYTFGGGAISVNDPDASTLQITLSATHGIVTLPTTSGLTFSSGGNASASMTFTGSQPDINGALHDLTYTPDSGYSGGASISLTANDLAQSGTGSALGDLATISVTVLPNQAPVNAVPGAQTVAEDAGLAIAGVSVSDPDGNLASVQLAVAHGNLTVSLAGGAAIADGSNGSGLLKLTGSQAQINAALATLAYRAAADYNGADTLTITSTDNASTPLTDTDTVAITLAAVNDAPSLSATGTNSIHVAGATGTGLFTGVQASAGPADEAGQLFTRVVLNVSGIMQQNGERLAVDGTEFLIRRNVSGTTAGGVNYAVSMASASATSGTVTLTSAGGLSAAALQSLVESIEYRYTATNMSAGNRVFTLVSVSDSGGIANGGMDTGSPNVVSTVTVKANEAPTLAATPLDPAYAEAAGLGTLAAPVAIFSNAAVSAVETGQLITGLVFTVSSLADGASERVIVDGTTIALQAGSGVTAANGLSYTVTLVNRTATVSLTSPGMTAAAMGAVIDGIKYQNANADNPTSGNRVFTITQIKDDGGTASGGSDTASLALASTVTVVAVNDAPTLTATALAPQYTEAPGVGTLAAPVSVFANAAISTLEAGQLITALMFTVSGLTDGAYEQFTVDGTSITAQAASGVTLNNGLSYNVTVSGGTATVSLTAAGVTSSVMQSVVNGITYQNTNADNPTSGDRVFTITQITDDAGTANGGVDAAGISISSTVTVHAIDDAPINTAIAAQTVAEDTPLALSGVSVHDPDDNLASVELSVARGTLRVSVAGGAVISGGAYGTALIELTGSEAQINAALATLTYQPAADYSGSDALTITSTDDEVLSNTDTVSITITPVADVVNDALTTFEDTAVTANVLSGSGSANADAFTGSAALTGVTQGAHGSVSFASDGTVKYTPDADWSGTDSFTYTATSGGTTETGTVAVTVAAVNDPPMMTATALHPVYREAPGPGTLAEALRVFAGTAVTTGDAGQTIIGMVFRVDGLRDGADERIGLDGSMITLAGNSAGVTSINGMAYSVTVANGGAIVSLTSAGMTPDAVQEAVDGITYRNTAADTPTPGARVFTILELRDNGGTMNRGSDTAALALASSVTVEATPDVPMNTLPGARAVAEDTPLAIGSISVADPDGDLASVELSVGHGTLSVDASAGATLTAGANGSDMLRLAGTPAQINAALATLSYQAAADYNGDDTLTVRSVDSTALSETGAVTITVTPVADVVDDALSGAQDTRIVANVLAGSGGASADGFSGSPALSAVGPAAHGNVSFDADGTVRYTPQSGWSGTDSFTYTAVSGGMSETATVTVNVAAAPVVVSPAPTKDLPSTRTQRDVRPSTRQDTTDGSNSTALLPSTTPSPVVTDSPEAATQPAAPSVDGPAAPTPAFRPFDDGPRMPTAVSRTVLPPLVNYLREPHNNGHVRTQPPAADVRWSPLEPASNARYASATVLAPEIATGRNFDERGFPLIRVPVLSGQIRGAGWAIEDVQSVGIAALFVYRGIHDTVVQPGLSFDIAIPLDAFAHTDPNAIVRVDVALGDGGALPDWLHFDRAAGRLIGIAPDGVDVTVRLAVIARDNAGRAVEATFQLRTANAAGQSQPPDSEARDLTQDPGALVGSERNRDGKRDDEAILMRRDTVRLAAPTFTEQLREARKDRLYEKVLGVLAKPATAARTAGSDVKVSDRLSLRH